MAQQRRRVLRIVVIYMLVASLWIIFSDRAIEHLAHDPARLLTTSIFKGLAFVFVTSVLLYSLVTRLVRQFTTSAEHVYTAQAERLQALTLLDAVVSGSKDAIFAKDTEGRYLLFNREATRVTGTTAEAVIGRDDRVVFPPDQVEQIMANDRRVMASDTVETFEEHLSTADGALVFMATKGPLHDADGRVIGMFGVSRDITPCTAPRKPWRCRTGRSNRLPWARHWLKPSTPWHAPSSCKAAT